MTVAAPTAAPAAPDTVVCPGTVAPAFAAFGDANLYALAPGGDMEAALSGWSLRGAELVAGSEPFAVTGTLGEQALAIAAGGSATTPAVCVDPTRETFRLVVRNASNARTRLRVEVEFRRGTTSRAVMVAYVTTPVGSWQPSPILRNIASNPLPGGGTTTARFRFTAEEGTVVIDDLYIDPRFRA